MGLFDTIRSAVGSDDAADGGGQVVDDTAGDSADDGPDVLDTREMDPAAFREHADAVVENAAPLDFATDALARLDAAIAESYDGRTAGPAAGATTYTENTVRFGSYLGEVLVRTYDAQWVERDGRWGVVVSGADDDVTVPVFDVAVRSFGDEPVFAALIERLESTLDLDASQTAAEADTAVEPESTDEREPTVASDATDDESDVADAVTKPTRLVDHDESDGRASGPERAEETTGSDEEAVGVDAAVPAADEGPDHPSESAQTRAVQPDEGNTQAAEPTDSSTDEARAPKQRSSDSPADTEAVDEGPDTESAVSPDPTDDGPPADAAASTDASTDAASDSADRPWDGVRAERAEAAVDFAEFWGEHDLDFSPASLSRLDDLVAEEWDDERFAETTFGSEDSFDDRAFTSVVTELGSYFGEVLVRNIDGEWTADTDHDAAVVVGGADARFAVPVSDVAITSLRERPVFGRSYDALLSDLGRDGPTR